MDRNQQLLQSRDFNEIDEIRETLIKNYEAVQEYKKGEEGVDFVKPLPEHDPEVINNKKLEREIRGQIDLVAVDEPEIAETMRKTIFSTDTELDEVFAMPEIPFEEIKFYPGSQKGPEPEDDPESYSKWFV